jgi:hypothetical protein
MRPTAYGVTHPRASYVLLSFLVLFEWYVPDGLPAASWSCAVWSPKQRNGPLLDSIELVRLRSYPCSTSLPPPPRTRQLIYNAR